MVLLTNYDSAVFLCTAVSTPSVPDLKAMSLENVVRQTAKTDDKEIMLTTDRQRVVPDTIEDTTMEGKAAGGKDGAGPTTRVVVAI